MQFGPDGDAKEPHSKGERARTTTSNGLFYKCCLGRVSHHFRVGKPVVALKNKEGKHVCASLAGAKILKKRIQCKFDAKKPDILKGRFIRSS